MKTGTFGGKKIPTALLDYRDGTSDEKAIAEVYGNQYQRPRLGFTIEPGDSWVDGGANIGAFAVFAGKLGAHVVAYEPEPMNSAIAQRNLTQKGLTDARVVRAAIIAEGRIKAPACFLPLTSHPTLSKEFGSRHRAAIGITEETDAVAVAASIAYWERLYAVVPPGSEDADQVRAIIEDVRGRAAAAGKPLTASKALASAPAAPFAAPPQPATGAPSAPAKPAAGGKTVSGTVKFADALAGKTSPTDTLFIYARAETGSRMPIAILRGGAGELPKSFELDDSMGMTPAVTISGTPSVVNEARVSKAGGAVVQSGDLIGASKPVTPGAKGVAVVIDKVVP